MRDSRFEYVGFRVCRAASEPLGIFAGRSGEQREALLAAGGGNRQSERAIALALHWIYRHQCSDGHWSLDHKGANRCSDQSCTGTGMAKADAGATAMGLLAFLAAGQTHKTNGPYRTIIQNALLWLLRHQDRDGNLAKGCAQPMYSHGLATIALCEAYGLSGDHNIGAAAQVAINFIVAAQNKTDFGWRYNPGDPGDTSAVGWQVTALKSAKLAGLNVRNDLRFGGEVPRPGQVRPERLQLPVPGQLRPHAGDDRRRPPLPPAPRRKRRRSDDDRRREVLDEKMPDVRIHNVYYWYYATQVLHNCGGREWDDWNHSCANLLIETQSTKGACANGSWDPDNPTRDAWGGPGGRHMATCLSCLALEVYYRYLPLYKIQDAKSEKP